MDAAVEGLNQIDTPGASIKKINESMVDASKILANSINRYVLLVKIIAIIELTSKHDGKSLTNHLNID